MQENQESPIVDETVVSNEVNQEAEQAPIEREIELNTNPSITPEQRAYALNEIDVLSRLINTSYYMPKWDMGNKGKVERKVTGSVQLNFFPGEVMQEWGQRITDLTKKLGL